LNGTSFGTTSHFHYAVGFRRVRKIAKSDYQFRHVCLCLSVRPRGTTRLPLDGFSWNL